MFPTLFPLSKTCGSGKNSDYFTESHFEEESENLWEEWGREQDQTAISLVEKNLTLS